MLSEEKVREIFRQWANRSVPTVDGPMEMSMKSAMDEDHATEFASAIEEAVREELHVEEWETRRCECGAKDACAFARERDRALAALDDAIKEERKRCASIVAPIIDGNVKEHGDCNHCPAVYAKTCSWADESPCVERIKQAILAKINEEESGK